MAENQTIARPYAEALFELARESGRLGQWANALETAVDIASDERVIAFMNDPRVTDDERLSLLTALIGEADGGSILAGDDEEGTNFLKLLIEYERIEVLPDIAEHFDALKDAHENTVEVTVTTAVPISDAHREEVRRALAERLTREIDLSTAVDPELIGGAVIRAGDFVIDGSVRAKLERLAGALAG